MWPWDWISAAGNAISGLSQKAVDWVNSLIASVMSWATDAINSIWRAIQGTWHDINSIWDWTVHNVAQVADTVWHWIDHWSHIITDWVLGMINALWTYAKGLYQWTLDQINSIWNYVYKLAGDIYGWVIREIWNPLYKLYSDIRDWAVQRFNQVWQYIEHPELLVQLIGAFLLRMWLQYATRYGGAIARWMIQRMMGLAGPVFDLLESILSNIL